MSDSTKPVIFLVAFTCGLISLLVVLQKYMPCGLPRKCFHILVGVGNLFHLTVIPQTTTSALISAILPILFGILLYTFANSSLLKSIFTSLGNQSATKAHAMLEYGICSGLANFFYIRNNRAGGVYLVGLVCLVFGDGLASLASFLPSWCRKYRAPDPSKTVAGMVTGSIGTMVGLYMSQNVIGLNLGLNITQMIILAASTSIIEALYISGEWDNITVFLGTMVIRYFILDGSYIKFGIVWLIIFMGELCAAKNYVTVHGAQVGVLTFFIHALAGNEFIAPLFLFVIGSFFASKVFKNRITALVDDLFTRNTYQVISNSYVGLLCSLLSHIYTGRNRQILLFLTFVNYAEAFSDTLASEIGMGLARPGRRVFVLGKFKLAPSGTDGGMSLHGTLASMTGAGAIAYLWCLQGERQLSEAAFIFGLGVQGSLIDSFLGSLFQESCILKDGRLGRPGGICNAVSLKNGKLRLSNTAINVLSVLLTSILGLILVLQGKVL